MQKVGASEKVSILATVDCNNKIIRQSSNDGFYFTIESKNVNLYAVKSAIYHIR